MQDRRQAWEGYDILFSQSMPATSFVVALVTTVATEGKLERDACDEIVFLSLLRRNLYLQLSLHFYVMAACITILCGYATRMYTPYDGDEDVSSSSLTLAVSPAAVQLRAARCNALLFLLERRL